MIKASTKLEIRLPAPEPASAASPPTAMPSEMLSIVADEDAAKLTSPPLSFVDKPGSWAVRRELSAKARTVSEISL